MVCRGNRYPGGIGIMDEEESFSHFELNDVWKIYKDKNKVIHALSRVNCSFNECSFNIIHGPSGCGKSTLIRMIGLLEIPTMGDIIINGQNTSDIPQKIRNSIIRDKIGMVFQSSNLIQTLNAIDNLTLPMWSSDNSKALELLKKVGYNDYNKFPKEMSIEEEQRVCIARAMVNDHSIILLDEPTGALHLDETNNIMNLLLRLNQTEGLTIILTTNNRELFKYDCNLYEMIDGTILKK
jgi:putative ABC transport system ATP-binding protein